MEERRCWNCGYNIRSNETECPNCGESQYTNIDVKYRNPKNKFNFSRLKLPAIISVILLFIMIISYKAMFRTDDNSAPQQSVSNSENIEKPLQTTKQDSKITTIREQKQLDCEIKEFVTYCSDKHLNFTICIHNPNTDYIAEPQYRITAKDADGVMIGTKEFRMQNIFPGEDKYFSFAAFSIDEIPDDIQVEITENKLKKMSESKYSGYKPLTLENYAVRDLESISGNKKKLVGEIHNPNNFDISTCKVQVIYRDENGALMYSGLLNGEYVDVKANSSTPFEMEFYTNSDNYDFYIDILW